MSLGYKSADGNSIQHKCHCEYLPLAQSEHEGCVCPLGWTLGPYSELRLMSHTSFCPLAALFEFVRTHIVCSVSSTNMVIFSSLSGCITAGFSYVSQVSTTVCKLRCQDRCDILSASIWLCGGKHLNRPSCLICVWRTSKAFSWEMIHQMVSRLGHLDQMCFFVLSST